MSASVCCFAENGINLLPKPNKRDSAFVLFTRFMTRQNHEGTGEGDALMERLFRLFDMNGKSYHALMNTQCFTFASFIIILMMRKYILCRSTSSSFKRWGSLV